jgi:hypothetical protein
MRILIAAVMAGILLVASVAASAQLAWAQGTTTAQSPTTGSVASEATPSAKELEGAQAFTSDHQELGKVVRTYTAPDGKVKDVEIASAGYFGFFKKNYLVPIEKVALKAGRVELSITNDQAQSLAK